jgi:3-dehydroquinate synthetase
MPSDDVARLNTLIRHLGPLPPVGDLRVPEAMDAITRDKKVVDGRLHFVLCEGLGRSTVAADVKPAELRAALRAIGLKA